MSLKALNSKTLDNIRTMLINFNVAVTLFVQTFANSTPYTSKNMSRTLPITHEMNFRNEFQTAILGYHNYKDVWVPCIGQRLKCNTDTREEAMQYDKNAIGFF